MTPDSPPSHPTYTLTAADVAVMLGLSEAAVIELALLGRLPAQVRPAALDYRFRLEDVRRFLAGG